MKAPYFNFWEQIWIFLWWNWPWLLVWLLLLVLVVIFLRQIDNVPLPYRKDKNKEEPQYRDFG